MRQRGKELPFVPAGQGAKRLGHLFHLLTIDLRIHVKSRIVGVPTDFDGGNAASVLNGCLVMPKASQKAAAGSTFFASVNACPTLLSPLGSLNVS